MSVESEIRELREAVHRLKKARAKFDAAYAGLAKQIKIMKGELNV